MFPKLREMYRNFQSLKTLGKTFIKYTLTGCKKQPANLRRTSSSSIFFQSINEVSKQQIVEKFALVAITL